MYHPILGDTKGFLTMFVRKKKYPSGNIGVIVVEKIGGKMRELATIAVPPWTAKSFILNTSGMTLISRATCRRYMSFIII